MTDISGDKAELVALWLETLLFGIYFSYFQQSIALLLWKRGQQRINWILIGVSVGIFLLAVAHNIMVFSRAIQALILFRDAKGGPIAYYNNLRSGLEVSQASCQIAISFLGDGMAIYRVWVVYNRRWVVMIVPLLSLVGTTVASIASVVVIGQASTQNTPWFLPKLETWMPIFFGLTFCTSVLCSLLIAGRLWYINHHYLKQFSSTGVSPNRLRTIQRIVIESASLYSATMLLYLCTYTAKTNYSIIFGDMVSPVIGIAFSLITIRVHSAFASSNNYTTTAPLSDARIDPYSLPTATHPYASPPSPQEKSAMARRNDAGPINVNITRSVDSRSDCDWDKNGEGIPAERTVSSVSSA